MKKAGLLLVVFALIISGGLFIKGKDGKAEKPVELELAGGISEKAMQYVPEEMKKNSVKAFGVSSQDKVDKSKFKINLTKEKKGENRFEVKAHGQITIDNKKLVYKTTGKLDSYKNPETGKEYLYGIIEGAPQNSSSSSMKIDEGENPMSVLLVIDMDDPKNKYYAAVSYGAAAEASVMIYGDAYTNREFNLMLEKHFSEEGEMN